MSKKKRKRRQAQAVTCQYAGALTTCSKCVKWDRERLGCKDTLRDEAYEESSRFRAYDRMMRMNRGVRTDA